MKATLLLCFAWVALSPAHAEIFRSDAGRGSHRAEVRRGDGRHDSRGHVGHHDRHYHASPWRHHDRWHGRVSYHYAPYRYVPSYGYYQGYGYGYPYYDTPVYQSSGSAAGNGLVLGALAGGIIGHNSGDFRHNGWRGAAWGAGLGWLLGSVVDANRRSVVQESPGNVMVSPAPAVPQPAAATNPQPITIINNYYNTTTPMSAANGMFGR